MKRSRSRSPAKSHDVVIRKFSGDTITFPAPVPIARVSKVLYPNTENYERPRLIYVDSKNIGHTTGNLNAGEYTVVKIPRKKLPTK